MSDVEAESGEAIATLMAAGATDALLAEAGNLPARDQRRLYREVRRLARGYRCEGLGAATVQFWVRRWWQRWFDRGSGGA